MRTRSDSNRGVVVSKTRSHTVHRVREEWAAIRLRGDWRVELDGKERHGRARGNGFRVSLFVVSQPLNMVSMCIYLGPSSKVTGPKGFSDP